MRRRRESTCSRLATNTIALNLLKLEQISGRRVISVDKAVAAARIELGPRIALVKHLS
ncbi:hypothetical protein [Sodalis-like endosymbiont of Proechinophthirus fluctus]|uniref:hypothetical protein n=1 Tax=Sodalis-like endosymbiont of Proechinophthirus fluctus TaxID=1462730 RepID=UPI000B0E3419